jgi:16S rRNA (cytosine967-C5)-methyltransferase
VQDAAASLPARLLGDVRGKTVIDLCAAPGGKTAQLAALGANVIALDRSATRLERLKGNLARLGLEARLVVGDALTWRPDAPAEAILLDAPCTGTGTLRRHPDIARTKESGDVERLAARQDPLLAAAIAMLAPGGVLVYAVCSLQPEEAEMRVAALLEAGAPMKRIGVKSSEIGGLTQAVTDAGDLRTLPCHLASLGGMDGFYAARLRRSG